MEDTVALKRLVLVKRLYLEGVDRVTQQYNYVDQLLVVINLFLAVETLMGAVILAVEQQPEQAIGTKGYVGGKPSAEQVSNFKLGDYHKFEQLFNQVVAILRDSGDLGEDEQLYKWGALVRLQKSRNDAQHGAKAPHPSDLLELSTVAREVIERILGLGFSQWGTSLADISLASLIEDDVLRQYMQYAENALSEGRCETCALLSRVAFLLGRLKRRYNWWKECRVLDDFDVAKQISNDWSVCQLGNRETRLLYNIMIEVCKLPYLFDNWILGLEDVDRKRLLELTPRLIQYPKEMSGLRSSDEVVVVKILDNLLSGEDEWAGPNFHVVPSYDECLWVLDFTIETLLRWQQEQSGRFTPVDTKYIRALPILEQVG